MKILYSHKFTCTSELLFNDHKNRISVQEFFKIFLIALLASINLTDYASHVMRAWAEDIEISGFPDTSILHSTSLALSRGAQSAMPGTSSVAGADRRVERISHPTT